MWRKSLKYYLMVVFCLFVCACTATTSSSSSSSSSSGSSATAGGSAEFDTWCDEQFKNELMSNFITFHDYCENGDDFGIDRDDVAKTFGTLMDEDTWKSEKAEVDELLASLKKFDRDDLSSPQQDVYDELLYQYEISSELKSEDYYYYAQEFSTATGWHASVSSTLSDFEFYSEEDIEDLIATLKTIPDYTDSSVAYTKTQAEKGYLLTDPEDVQDQIADVIEAGTDSAVLTALNDHIADLGLSDEKTKSYQSDMTTVFKDCVIASLKKIDALMDEVKANYKNKGGYANFPNGKAYYALLLKQACGRDITPDEFASQVKSYITDDLTSLRQVANASEAGNTSLDSYEKILSTAEDNLSKYFPDVEDMEYEIKDIDEEIAYTGGTAAYFVVPAVDTTRKYQIRVNPTSDDITSLDTYMTVCHEGIPGHMYQFKYLYENAYNNLQKISPVIGYYEGWAVYAGYFALNYLSGSISQSSLLLYKFNEITIYDVILLCDYYIHYEGYSLTDIQNVMSQYGLNASGDGQYLQNWSNPCLFQPYYYGYHQMFDAREKAQDALGDNFDYKSFHEALLKANGCPYSVVDKYVDAYIQEGGGSSSSSTTI